MTGLERLRELAEGVNNGWMVVISPLHVKDIADQIEQEHAQTCEDHERQQQVIRDLQRKRDEALRDARHRERTRLSIMQVLAVVTEMEHHVRGVDGAEDSPVARWAAMLREAVRCPAEAEEDARAAKWVREHGGIEEVSGRNWFATECAAKITGSDSGEEDGKRLLDALDRRLMPPGMEWPRYDTGELVDFGDEIDRGDGDSARVDKVVFYGDQWRLFDRYGCEINDDMMGPGDRVRRPAPAVLAADGEPLEVGQTVYASRYDYVRCTVLSFEWVVDGWLVEVENEGGTKFRQTPDCFTHQRPVLDADGVPIHEGDHGWWLEQPGVEIIVKRIDQSECAQLTVYDVHARGNTISASEFTHTKPEPPDSAERIAEDIRRMAEEWCSYPTLREASEMAASSVGEATMGVALSNLSKRCRALAERERGEW